jgi:DNA-binding NtrC family response regulator
MPKPQINLKCKVDVAPRIHLINYLPIMRKNATILFVDDEKRILRSLKALFKPHYNVHITTDGHEALEIVKNNTVHVIVSDQRMPVMSGVELLRQVKQVSPTTMRLLLTGYADLPAIIDSVNDGEIFRYISKPWDNDEIIRRVKEAAQIGLELAVNIPSPITNASSEKQALEILVIDDDIGTYNAVQEIVGQEYTVKWGATLKSAFEILSQGKIMLLISEIHVADEDMSLSLKLMKQHHPDIITIVLTNFNDAQSLIDLINQGQIFRFLPKPIRKPLLANSLKAGIQRYLVAQQRPELLIRHSVEAPKPNSMISGIMAYLNKIKPSQKKQIH